MPTARFEGRELHDFLITESLREGFALAGGVDIRAALEDPEGRFAEHVRRYDHWLAQGRHGSMQYLARGRDRRADPRLVLPGARAVFSVAIPYPRAAAGALTADEGVRYARYLQRADYHRELAERLERVLVRASAESRARGAGEISWKICVDTSAVLERTWAALAGLGWLGKNTLLIHPKLGSYLFIAEVLLDRELEASPRPLADYCGNCTRCIRSCPTGAIEPTREVEPRRCISYLTLEQRGEWELPVSERPKVGAWIAGCDICQEVCPFNLKPVKAELEGSAWESDSNSGAPDALRLRHWIDLVRETEDEYRMRVKDSSLRRVKPHQFSRNLAVTLESCWSEIAESRSNDELQALISAIRERALREADPSVAEIWNQLIDSRT